MTTEQPAAATPPTFDRAAARQQCLLLARGDASERFVFQTFPDRDEDKQNAALTATRYGTCDACADWLAEMNAKKAGVFVTVQSTHGSRRHANDIAAMRAAFFDHDEKDGPMRAAPSLLPSMTIRSGHGSHGYFLLTTPAPASAITPIQIAIAQRLGTDPAVVDPSRVMRLAGSANWKYEPVPVVLVEAHLERVYTLAQVADAFGVDPAALVAKPRSERPASPPAGEPTADHRRIRQRCPWFNRLFTHPQEAKEDNWFAGLSIVARCIDAETVAHEMSCGHPDYTRDETDQKLARAAGYESLSCRQIAILKDNASCSTCPHRNGGGRPMDFDMPEGAAEEHAEAPGGDAGAASQKAEESPAAIAEAAVRALEMGRPQEFLRKATFTALAALDSDDRDLFVLRIRNAIRSNRRLGVTKKDVDARLEAAIRARARQDRSRGRSGLPIIQVNDAQLRDVADAAMVALAEANDRDPSLFVRCGKLVRITSSEVDDLPSTEEFRDVSFKGRLSRVADFTCDAGNRGIMECAPTDDLVKEILYRAEYPELPYLAGVTTAPIARPDGSFHTTPGFDPETGLFYAPIGDPVSFTIPDRPTPEDVDNAVQALRYPFQDFPLVGKSGFAHILALELTMLLRPLFKGSVPAFLIRATTQGTGKSLIVEACGITVSGCAHFSTFAPAENEAEMRKRITSALMESRPVIAIDNVDGRLSSESLASLITTGTWADRKLGGNTNVRIRNRVTVTVNGNNVQVDDDLLRRLLLIDLNYEGENPEQRTGFVIPILKEWIIEHRDELLAALMLLVRNWHVLGKPKPTKVRPFGSFEEWLETVGGIIEAAGVDGLRDDQALMATLNDGLTAQWGAFLRAVHHLTWGQPFSVSDIAEQCPDARANRLGDPLLADTLPGSIAARSDRGSGSLNHALGQNFKRLRSMNCKGFTLEQAGVDPRSNVNLWRVRASRADEVAEPSKSGMRFLDLLRAAGWWEDEDRQQQRDADARSFCNRTVGQHASPTATICKLPILPAPGADGYAEALRPWLEHFMASTHAKAEAEVVHKAHMKAILARMLALPPENHDDA